MRILVLLAAAVTLGNAQRITLVAEPNVLSPPYFNIATGKQIESTSTCGEDGEDVFCKLTGGPNEYGFDENIYQGQFCDVCNNSNPVQTHSVQNAIDGTEKWWQSPPLSKGNKYNEVNVTIHLGQVFHVAYILIKFANSPRAGTWVLERSSDHGKTFQPWQYFANSESDCHNRFGIDAFETINRDDSVLCTADYSDVVPLENGEVIVSLINRRPGAKNFSHSPVLQEWSKATDIRLRLLRTKTLLGHLMAVERQDPTVTRRYFYSIKDVSIGGRCVCNGHADTCLPDPLDRYKLKCQCTHNTCGDSCEKCCPKYVQKAWRPAVPESSNECEACNCHGHSFTCHYDEDIARRRLSLDLSNNYEGGGVCDNCLHHTTGINCEQCEDGFYRPANVDPTDPNGCRPCNCNNTRTVGTCEPVTGRCYCLPKYSGDRCDECAPGFFDFPECKPCPCYYNATRDEVCQPPPEKGVCPCKYNFGGKYCDECASGFYNFPECAPCQCTNGSVTSDVCDQHSGECPCVEGFGGKYCDECAPGYFDYPLCRICACTSFTTPEVCDKNTGQCHCSELVTGPSCSQCKPGYFDFPTCKECQCTKTGSQNDMCDPTNGKCTCKPNFQGDACDQCAPEYYDYPNCIPCDCNVQGSKRTTCDQVTGQCTCNTYINGRQCDQCAPDYFNFPRCEDCKCNPFGIKDIVPGICLAFSHGQCDCKDNVMGKYCDVCKPLHYNVTQGCPSCNCFLQGTLDGVAACDTEDGQCWCKPYTCTQRCSQCDDGFYGLREANYLGCDGCQCDVGGAMSYTCDKNTGQCECRSGVEGRACDKTLAGYYFPTLLQHKFEVEDGKTDSNRILRYLSDEAVFPGYSMRGYAVFSGVQRRVNVPFNIDSDSTSSLYQLVFYYTSDGMLKQANVTVEPLQFGIGSAQSFKVQFEPASDPTIHKVSQPLVLNKGKWNVVIEAEEDLLIDYFALLPSEYYEPGRLQISVTEPCVPQDTPSDDLCLMYSHIDISKYPQTSLTQHTDKERHGAPTTAHPMMVILDGNSITANGEMISAQVQVESVGKYVIVIEYASSEDSMQTIAATVTDSSGQIFNDVKFNIYACQYSFLCRQVALTPLSDVMVFDISSSDATVQLKVDAGEHVYVRSVHLIPYDEWTMEQVEPNIRCITKQGPEFEACVGSAYPIPYPEYKFEVDGGAEEVVPTATDPDVSAASLGKDNNQIQIPINLDPGRYVFILHYYNPSSLSFSPEVLVSGGVSHQGTANVTYCPHGDGCRAVVKADNGKVVLDITTPQTLITITVPEDRSLYLDYVLAIPERSYNPSDLELTPVDLSRRFFEQCLGRGYEGLERMGVSDSEFCRDSVFSLTTHYNDGALPCECDGAGAVGGESAVCIDYGGQCPCKPNVIGRQCTICKPGYYGFPDCKPCECGGALCDDVTGECICPPNTIEPPCNECLPFTHSFHPLAGCEECDCNSDGVENATDLGCNKEDGQCRCRENVEGHKCDKCKPGYYGFPACNKCVCQESGRISEGCDAETGNCICKENVEGQQCDRCKSGTFFLDPSNPLGCTSCFCFGVSNQCHSTQYPMKIISNMDDWRIQNLASNEPDILRTTDGETLTVNLPANGGPSDISNPHIYWAAPKDYLFNKVGSYGGVLTYTTSSTYGGRGDSGRGGPSAPQPAPISSPVADVIIHGEGMAIGWVNRGASGGGQPVTLRLIENNFVHQVNKQPVRREEMMVILSSLSSLKIRATSDPEVYSVSISNVEMTTTDYDKPIGSGASIPTVEECVCPDEYVGQSCELCEKGHYRNETFGLYLGVCLPCECFGHCDTCGPSGELMDDEDCLHNTMGYNCEICAKGFIGNATSGDPDACQPCPCPNPIEGRNFAESCEGDINDEVICNCKEGYTGPTCSECAYGYFGNPTTIGGECTKCNCHDNQDSNMLMETCDPITGECSDCAYNTGGKYCERCADGFHGDAHVRNCTQCSCFGCGTEVCDHQMGHCACRPHVLGELCDKCEPGFFNIDSCIGCLDCQCGIGARSSVCDEITGVCECAPNVVGDKCDKCAPGHWDYSEAGCKPCKCRNNGACNPENGECQCPPGITGIQCDQCKLERHILLPGEMKCEGCDSCVHDLLNTIGPLTRDTQVAADKMSSVSVGVGAQRKLDQYKKDFQDIKDSMLLMDEEIANAETLLDPNFDPFFDLSGSGDNELPPAPLTDADSGNYSTLDGSLRKIENDVSTMCNHTQALLDMVTETNEQAVGTQDSATALQNDMNQFVTDAEELVTKLDEESSGDDEDYLMKLNNAGMMIAKMKERDFTPQKDVADAEMLEAQALFDMVGGNFTAPATDIDDRVTAMSDDLAEKQAKMNELRTLLNEATKKVTDVNSMNDANNKTLLTTRDLINAINEEFEKIQQTLEDAEVLIERDAAASPEVLGTDLLNEEVLRLQPAVDKLLEGLKRIEGIFNESIAKADMLSNDADVLVQIVEETNSEPRVLRAVEAANRYQTIVNTMNAAKEAADQAKIDATAAQASVSNKNLDEASNAAETRASTLLSEANDIQNDRMNRLESDLNDATGSIDAILASVDGANEGLDNIDERINELNPGDTLEKARQAKDISAEANSISSSVNDTANAMQDQINSAPDPNVPVQEELLKAQNALADVPDELNELTDRIADMKRSAERIANIPTENDMDSKINKIRKRIELARALAENVKVAMSFRNTESAPEFSQPRIPPQISSIEDALTIELYVNVSTQPDNGILYFGDASTANGDYMMLETVDGQVRYNYKVGGGVGTLISNQTINDNLWHKIEIQRNGNEGVLRVEYPSTESNRGDGPGTGGTLVDEKFGTTDSEDTRSMLPPESTVFFIGGVPLIQLPDNTDNQRLNGQIEDVKMNKENVGIWNFHAYNGQEPAPFAERKGNAQLNNAMWKFRGGDSYVRIGDENYGRERFNTVESAFFVQFKIQTLEDNALVFLVGNTTDNFFALELINRQFVVTSNFNYNNNSEIIKKELSKPKNISTGFPLVIKAGVLPSFHLIVLTINREVHLRAKFTTMEPNLMGDAWFGGVYSNDMFDVEKFRPHLQTIDTHFRGCLGNIAVNTKTLFDPYNAKERVGVERGCNKEAVTDISFDGNSYVAVASDLANVADFSGSLSASTTADDGTLLDVTSDGDGDSEMDALNTEIISALDNERNSGLGRDTNLEVARLEAESVAEIKREEIAFDIEEREESVMPMQAPNSDPPTTTPEKTTNDATTENMLIEPEFIPVMKEESKDMNTETPTTIEIIDMEKTGSMEIIEEDEFDVTIDEIDIVVTDAPAAVEVYTTTNSSPVHAPTINIDENALSAEEKPIKEDSDTTGMTVLPAVLIVIAVVVAVTLVAGVVSLVLKSSFIAGNAANPPPPPSPEQQYLNNVQPDRIAQIQW